MPIKAEFIILILSSIQLLSVCFSIGVTANGIDAAEYTKNHLTGDSLVSGEASSLESAHYLVRIRRDDSQLSSETTEIPLLSTSSTVEPSDGYKTNVASSKKSKSKHSKHSSKGSKSSTTTTSTPLPTTTTSTESPQSKALQTTTKAKIVSNTLIDEPDANSIASTIQLPANNDDEDPKESATPIIASNSFQDQDSPSKLTVAALSSDPSGPNDDGAQQPDNQQPKVASLSTTDMPPRDTTSNNNPDQNGPESGASRAELPAAIEPKPVAPLGLMPDLADPKQPIVEPALVATKSRKPRKKKKKGFLTDPSGKSGKRKKGKKGKRKKAIKKSTKILPPVEETKIAPVGAPIAAEIVPPSNNSPDSILPSPPTPAAKLTTVQPTTSVDKKPIVSTKPLTETEHMELEELEKIERQAKLNNFQFKKVTLKLLGDVSNFLSANGNKAGEIDWRSTVAHGIGEVLFGLGASKMFDQDIAAMATSGGSPTSAITASGSSRSSSDSAEFGDEATDSSGSSRADKAQLAAVPATTTKAPQKITVSTIAPVSGLVSTSKPASGASASTTTHSPTAKAPSASPAVKSTPPPSSTAAPSVVPSSTVKPATAVSTTAKLSVTVSGTTKAPSSPAPSLAPSVTPSATPSAAPSAAPSPASSPAPSPSPSPSPSIAPPPTPSTPPTTTAPAPVVSPTTTLKPLLPTTAAPAAPITPSVTPVAVAPQTPASLPPAVVSTKPAAPTAASAAGAASTDGPDVSNDRPTVPKKLGRKPLRRLALLNRYKNAQGNILRNRLRTRNRLGAQPAVRIQRKPAGKNGRTSKILIMKKGPRRVLGGARQKQLGLRRPVVRNDDYSDTDYSSIDSSDDDDDDGDDDDDDDYASLSSPETAATDDAASPDYDQQQPVEYDETAGTVQQPRKKPKGKRPNRNKSKSKKANNGTRKNKRKKMDESDPGSGRSSLGTPDAVDNSYDNYDDLNVDNNNVDIEY